MRELFSDSGFLSDFKRIQVISGFAAFSGVVMTLFAIFLFPVSNAAKQNIIYISLATALFIVVYYLVPKLYMSKRWAFIPDLVYISAISFVSRELGSYGSIYFLFYMILAAVDAFIFPTYQYIIVMLGMIIGVLFSMSPLEITSPRLLYEIYALVVLAIVLQLISRDASRIKKHRDELETEIAKLDNDKREIRSLLESISDGMFVVDSRNKITFYNPSALKILKIIAPEEKILGRDINDFLNTVGSEGPEEITRDAFGKYQASIRDDLRIVRAERVIKLHTNTTPVIGKNKKLQGAIIFFRDITEEKKLDEQRSEFNAIASHELRSPLTVMEGYLYFLLDPSSGAKYNKVTKEYIEKAHNATEDLIRLISDILTVVKAEDDKLTVTLQKTDLKVLSQKIVKNFTDKANEKKLKISFKTTAPDIPEIITDSVKFKEILTNLVENAIKFTDKGSVSVELGVLENEAIVKVTDTGPGVEEKEQKMVFQRFYRSENWKTRKTGGTGLGLFIVKALTERLGGRVGLQSTPGKGSRFYFTLPLKYQNKEDLKTLKERPAHV